MKNTIFALLSGLVLTTAHTAARAEINLDRWKHYAHLAEQGAVCASFSALMEAQSLLNRDMGRLWQERRKFAGAVISKAVRMELGRDADETEINQFIGHYRDWVLARLMMPVDDSAETAGDIGDTDRLSVGRERIASLIQTQCALLFEQGDKQITVAFPELAYLTDKRANSDQTQGPDRSLQETEPVINTSTDEPRTNTKNRTETKKQLPPAKEQKAEAADTASGNIVALAVGGGRSFNLQLPGSSSAARQTARRQEKKTTALPASRPQQLQNRKAEPVKNRPDGGVPAKPQQHAANEATAEQQRPQNQPPAKTVQPPRPGPEEIAASELIVPVSLLSSAPETGDFQISFGEFSTLAKARTMRAGLQARFPRLFARYPLSISDLEFATGDRTFSIDTAPVTHAEAQQLCALLWPHQISCLVKNKFKG